MIRSSLVFFLLAFTLPPQFARASDSTSMISCEQFVVDGGSVEEVCAEHQMMGSSAMGGDEDHIYNILELDNMTADEMETMTGNYTQYLSGLVVEVKIMGTTGSCEVTINGTACANCEVCGDNSTTSDVGVTADDSVSVDCSAVPGGRAVECEPLDNVFFPFAGYVLDNATDDGGAMHDGGSSGLFPVGSGASSQRCMTVAFITTVVAAAVETILQL